LRKKTSTPQPREDNSSPGVTLGPPRVETGGAAPAAQDVATEVDTEPVLLSGPKPNYTDEARRNKTQGIVVMRLLIGPDGRVIHGQIISGLPHGLSQEALRTGYMRTYKPAMKNGRRVPYWITVEVEFKL
jgi:protein TonB